MVLLLSQFNANPLQGHLDGARHVLRYLKGALDWGIQFREGTPDGELTGHAAWPAYDSEQSAMEWP